MPDAALPIPRSSAGRYTSHEEEVPPPTEPFTTLQELAVWVQEPSGIPTDRISFAMVVVDAVAVVIRDIGNDYWTYATIPPRVKLIADLKAKNFYEHPTGAVSETVGPLSERFLDEVVQQLVFSDDERNLIASYSSDEHEAQLAGIWVLTATRGPMETHQRTRQGITHVPYWRATSKPIPYFAAGDLGTPESP